MILLDLKDSRPIYEQVVERLQELMMLGILEEDSQMPSVRSLAMELSINPNTIQRAYGELERRGYTYSVKGAAVLWEVSVSCGRPGRQRWQKSWGGWPGKQRRLASAGRNLRIWHTRHMTGRE